MTKRKAETGLDGALGVAVGEIVTVNLIDALAHELAHDELRILLRVVDHEQSDKSSHINRPSSSDRLAASYRR